MNIPKKINIVLIVTFLMLASSCNIGHKGYSGERLDISNVATIRGEGHYAVVAFYVTAEEFYKELMKPEEDRENVFKNVRGSEIEVLPGKYVFGMHCVHERGYDPTYYVEWYAVPYLELTVDAGTFYVLGCEELEETKDKKVEEKKYKAVLRTMVHI